MTKKEPPVALVKSATDDGDYLIYINLLCADLLADISRRKERERQGETALVRRGLCYAPARINRLISDMVWRCHFSSVAPPKRLAQLVTLQLTGDGHTDQWEKVKKRLDYIKYRSRHPDSSARKVARIIGVDDKTVNAWDKEKTAE